MRANGLSDVLSLKPTDTSGRRPDKQRSVVAPSPWLRRHCSGLRMGMTVYGHHCCDLQVSMPGMMDTVLNLGLNDAVVAGLARKAGERFAWDSYRRFLDMYASVVMGIEHRHFEHILTSLKVPLSCSLPSFIVSPPHGHVVLFSVAEHALLVFAPCFVCCTTLVPDTSLLASWRFLWTLVRSRYSPSIFHSLALFPGCCAQQTETFVDHQPTTACGHRLRRTSQQTPISQPLLSKPLSSATKRCTQKMVSLSQTIPESSCAPPSLPCLSRGSRNERYFTGVSTGLTTWPVLLSTCRCEQRSVGSTAHVVFLVIG
jgi:hypothetical protein